MSQPRIPNLVAQARLRVQQMKEQGWVDYMALMKLLDYSSLTVTQIYSQEILKTPKGSDGAAAAAALLPQIEVS